MSAAQSGFPGFQIGNLSIGYFGLIILTAALAAAFVGWRVAVKAGEAPDAIPEIVITALLCAIVVGRVGYILSPPPSVATFYDRGWYFTHMTDLLVGPFAIWSGGLDSGGMLVGTLLGTFIVIRRRRLTLPKWADIVSICYLVFLVIAPLANLVNTQQLGPPTNLPWGVPIDLSYPPVDNVVKYPSSVRFHPTPAYVSVFAVAVLFVLPITIRIVRVEIAPGGLFVIRGLALMSGLALLDFFRLDVSQPLFALTLLQLTCVILFILLLSIFIARPPIKTKMRERIGHSQPNNS